MNNVLKISYVFTNTGFNQPLNNWNVGSVVNMNGTLFGACKFNKPLVNCNVENVIDKTSISLYMECS